MPRWLLIAPTAPTPAIPAFFKKSLRSIPTSKYYSACTLQFPETKTSPVMPPHR
jgi:hypothetical protein